MNKMFGLIAGVLDLIWWLALVAFVASGTYFFVSARNAQGAIKAKRNSRALKFFGLALALVVLNVFLPMWLVSFVAIGGGAVAYNRTRKVKYPLNGSSSRSLPRWPSY
jgi:uncharacterized iron-regulated membrane protein